MKHKHHIIPKHVGGTDDTDNIIELSVVEHAEAHRLLWEQYGRWQDFYAWQGLSGQIGKEELIRKIQSVANSKPKSEETKRKMSEWQIGRKLSEEHKNKISDNKKGKKQTQEHIQKRLLSMKGFKQTEHQKQVAKEKFSKNWSVTSPDGNTQIITNLRKFCKDNQLDQGNLSRGSHKGWKCIKIGR